MCSAEAIGAETPFDLVMICSRQRPPACHGPVPKALTGASLWRTLGVNRLIARLTTESLGERSEGVPTSINEGKYGQSSSEGKASNSRDRTSCCEHASRFCRCANA